MKFHFFLFCFVLFLFSFGQIEPIQKPKNKIELGRKLFFDNRLSSTNTIHCGSCHKEAFAFADTSALSKGVLGRKGHRNTPSAMNMLSRDILFYDGRAKTLEEQAVFPIENHLEMNLSIDSAVKKIAKVPQYQKWFQAIYHTSPNKQNILDALAAFERSLESYSPFDDYMAGDTLAISASARRGHELFIGSKTKCFECHFSPDFTGDEFRNIGLFDGKTWNDSGRYIISRNPKDLGKFKVPGLRNVAITAPYMHNGRFKTLKETIEYYQDIYKVVPHPINEDSLVMTATLMSPQDMVDIENFLISLTDYNYLKLLKHEKNTAHRRRK